MGLMRRGWVSGRTRRRVLVAAGVGAAGLVLLACAQALTEPRVVALVGIAGLIAPLVIVWVQRRWTVSDASVADERRGARDRELMRRRVRNRWIKGVLEQSAHEARIMLGLTRRLDAIQRPGMTIRCSGRKPEPLRVGMPISAVFAEAGGALLILGAPGSGKTTALLELSRALLDQADADDTRSIPAVFNLSSWAVQRPPLHEWLVDELRKRYDVPRSLARRWVNRGDILPLLDGLDEVVESHRQACVEAINAFRDEHGLVPFAVCSRTQEYTALASRLRVEDAVELQPPTRRQVEDYLMATGASLADVEAALETDPTLWELLRSPLVLSIVALTYSGRPALALRTSGTPEERLTLLFEAYTERMLTHRPGHYTPTRTLHSLTWLARSMRSRTQTEFHLDRLDAGWLPTKAQRRLVPVLLAIGVGLIVGLVVGLAVGVLFGLVAGMIGGLFFGLTAGTVTGVLFGLVTRLRSRLVFGLYAGLVVGPFYGELAHGELGEPLVTRLVYGTLFGLAGGLIGGLTRVEPVENVRWSWTRLGAGMVYGAIGGWVFGVAGDPPFRLVLGLVVTLVGGLGFGLVSGLTDERSTPNEGIHRSSRYALAFGLLFGGLFGLVGLIGGLPQGLGAGLLFGLAAGMIVVLVGGLSFGGLVCLQHLVLRSLLAYHSYAPLRYVQFLNEATEQLFLRRVGSGYIFIHRLLLDYFAELGPMATASKQS